jgi:hypothetical protein
MQGSGPRGIGVPLVPTLLRLGQGSGPRGIGVPLVPTRCSLALGRGCGTLGARVTLGLAAAFLTAYILTAAKTSRRE